MGRRWYNHRIKFRVYLIDSSDKCKNQPCSSITFYPREYITYQKLIRKITNRFPVVGNVDFILTCVNEYYERLQVQQTKHIHKAIEMKFLKNLYLVYNYKIDEKDGNSSFLSQFFCNYCCCALTLYRFRCVQCPHYDLCYTCNGFLGVHSDHKFEKLNVTNPYNTSQQVIPKMRYSTLFIGKKVGEGSFGEVFKASPRNKPYIKWAVKRLKDCDGMQNDLIKELKVFQKIGEHENIVKLKGWCEYREQVIIVMNYVCLRVDGLEVTSLNSYLQLLAKKSQRKNFVVNGQELVSFFMQVARGMQHLEANKIVHRDLATRNILIDGRKFLKISDFGLARNKYYYEAANDSCPIRWAAPEVLTNESYSNKSDVWAYGVVIWEIASLGKVPYGLLSVEDTSNYVLKGNRLEKPKCIGNLLYKLMCACWRENPRDRPDFATLVSKLTDINWMIYE